MNASPEYFDDEPKSKKKPLEWLLSLVGMDNIAEVLDEQTLTDIYDTCNSGLETDKQSRAEWETRQDEYMKLALQVMETKTSPWRGASNVKYPLLTTATMQFGARAYPGLVPGPNIAKGRVTGRDPTGEKAKKAERVGKHLSYQLIEEMTGWEEDMDKLCVSLPIVACLFKKVYFSPSKNRNCSELIYPKNLVVNYWTKTLEDAHRITHILNLSDNDVQERINSGLFLDQEYEKRVTSGDKTSNEVHGTSEPSQDDSTPVQFYEQHTFIDLDGDGYKEPYIVTFSDKVARIVAAFEPEGILAKNGKIIRINRINYFVKYGFVPNPDGSFYDIGFGNILGPINEVINTSINQLNDAGSLANGARGFIGRGVRLKKGETSLGLNEWRTAQNSGDDLRKAFFQVPAGAPSPVLFQLLSMMIEAGKELANTVPMLMGQNPGQNQPATTSMAVIEQGLKVFSSIFKRNHRSLKQEFKLLHRLNRIYLPTESYFQVLDVAEAEAEAIYQSDYSKDETDVQPYSDPNIVSETQLMIKAQQIMELMKNQLLPNPAEGAKQVCEAMDLPNIDKLMTPPQPQPDPELEFKIQQHKDLMELEWAKVNAKIEEMESKKPVDESTAILNMAKAEAQEVGTQLDDYQARVDAMQLDIDNENERKQQELQQQEIDLQQQQMQQQQQAPE